MAAEPNHQRHSDYVIDQGYSAYSESDHAIWRDLYLRQSHLLPNKACTEFMAGLNGLGVVADKIPDFEALSTILMRTTGWRIVAVPGLLPDDVFFRHLSERRFPITHWIRRRDQMDYLQEPDVFHDLFGHVPLLMNPVFADYLQAYGRGGLKALGLNALPLLARLYWYTVEFGLIKTDDGLRIYGSGIVSSFSETRYCLENSTPLRLGFDLERIMRTRYRIDDFQETYFVINNFDQLFEATAPDFAPLYERVASQPEINPGAAVSNDTMIAITG